MTIEYTKKVIEHFRNPKNVGEIENPDVEATEGSPACGDMVTIQLKIDKKTKKITDIKFRSYGCASNIATASIVTELAKGKTIEEAEKITWKQAMEELGGLPPIKVHCSVLAIDTLKSAIKNYEEKEEKSSENKGVTQDKILNELSKVVHPELGKPITDLKMILYVGLKEDSKNTWLIEINLDKEDKFYNNIVEEVKEHLDNLNIKYEVKFIKYNKNK